MDHKERAARLGKDPFKKTTDYAVKLAEEVKAPAVDPDNGVSHLIKSTVTPKAAPSEEIPETQGKKGQKRHRLNVAFSEANRLYIQRITRLDGLSVSEYINGLIKKDRDQREHKLEQIEALLKDSGRED